MHIGLHAMHPLFLSYFNETWIFLTDFQKYLIIRFYETCPVGAKLFHVDEQTDMTKLIVAFCNFVKVPKSSWAGEGEGSADSQLNL
jgi:hypothetical protein